MVVPIYIICIASIMSDDDLAYHTNQSPHYSLLSQSRRNVRWKRGEMLGQGACGVVYLGLNVETGECVCGVPWAECGNR